MRYEKKLPQIVIFGRTNVGKSTLFNCLTEKNQALVSNIEGTTRDSNIGLVNWQGKTFQLIDTGGIIDLKYLTGGKKKVEDIEGKVQKQARAYLENADLILFLVDNKTGLLPQDKQMNLLLKKILQSTENVFLVANKVDNIKQRPRIAEFHKLALGEPIPVSAANGSGTGDLLDIIVKKIKKVKTSIQNQTPSALINVSIIGKPNVGKSSLLNSILGYERVIVSPEAHTTREPQDTEITYGEQTIKIIDTAGISKKGTKTKNLSRHPSRELRKYGIEKTLSTLKKSDLAMLVLDISEDITRQDAKLVEEIFNRKISLIIIANKWDLIKEKNTKKYINYIYSRFPFAQFAPIQFTSALTGAKTKKILDLIIQIAEERKIELTDSQLSHFLNRIVKLHKPAKSKGTKHPRIYSIQQVKINPPKFEIKIGARDNLHFSYLRFIENRLRDKFNFLGTPITTVVAKNKLVHGKHEK